VGIGPGDAERFDSGDGKRANPRHGERPDALFRAHLSDSRASAERRAPSAGLGSSVRVRSPSR
jgi:hypothetical protein